VGGAGTVTTGREGSQETSQLPFLIGLWGAVYLHDNEEVEDQDEGGQEGPGDLVAGQEAAVQVVPADPVSTDDQNHHRRQGDEHRPARRGEGEERMRGEERRRVRRRGKKRRGCKKRKEGKENREEKKEGEVRRGPGMREGGKKGKGNRGEARGEEKWMREEVQGEGM